MSVKRAQEQFNNWWNKNKVSIVSKTVGVTLAVVTFVATGGNVIASSAAYGFGANFTETMMTGGSVTDGLKAGLRGAASNAVMTTLTLQFANPTSADAYGFAENTPMNRFISIGGDLGIALIKDCYSNNYKNYNSISDIKERGQAIGNFMGW